MKRRDIWLVALLVAFGLLYHAIEKNMIHFSSDFSFLSPERRLKGDKFLEFPEGEKQFALVKKIKIENPAGEVVINRSSDEKVRISSSLRIYYTDQSDVERIRGRIQIRCELKNDELEISSRYGAAFPYQRARILLRLSVPPGTILDVSNQEGDTLIKDTGKDVLVDQENGNLVLANIPSNLWLKLRNCNADISALAENADIVAYYAKVSLENAAALRFKGEHSDCTIRNVKKDAYIDHAYGKLDLDGADKVEISGHHSEIVVKNIANGAMISDDYEDVLLENVGGEIRLKCRLSGISLHHVSGTNVVIENSLADTDISDFSGDNLDLLLKNGNLDLQAKSVSNRINIESQHAELDLDLGVLSDPTFNIKTKHGRIEVQSPLLLDTFEENAESFANRDGQKPEILIHNVYGDVRIKSRLP
jgi:hypothetical protein